MITPQQHHQLRGGLDSQPAKQLEEQIDTVLAEKDLDYMGRIVIAASLLGKRIGLRDAVLSKYVDAGWSVNYCADQRDGDYFEFRPAEMPQPPKGVRK